MAVVSMMSGSKTPSKMDSNGGIQARIDNEMEADESERTRVLTFPGDLDITIKPKKRAAEQSTPSKVYVTMERDELESLVDARAEALFEARAEALFEARAATLVKDLIRREFGDTSIAKTTSFQDEEFDLKEELVEPEKAMSLKSETEEQEWHAPFGETVYTLLYMCPALSQGFLYSLFVYAVQITTISLTLADVVRKGTSSNRLDLPPMVGLTVTAAQGVTCFVVLAYMSDLIEAVIKIQDGFYPEVVEKHPGATYNTWLFSCLAQLMAGALVLVSSFILTMQASTVLDLMLNLTALLFMAEIDDIGFSLAKNGFVTDQLQREAESVLDFRVPKPKRSNIQRRILYLLALVGLLVGFVILKGRQLEGKYLPTFIYVQFGDAYNPKIPYYSGILSSGKRRDYDFDYREYRDLGTRNILLAYCYDEQSWTFSDTDEACDYFAKSTKTKAYDVTSIPASSWSIKDSIDRLQPFDSFTLVGRDCDPTTCQGICGEDGLCTCPHDRFGTDCEFKDVCQELQIDGRFGPFPSVEIGKESFAISNTFHLLKNPSTQKYVRVYTMPVYYSNSTFPADIIFYGGRRWIMTSEWDLFNLTLEEMTSTSKFFLEKTVETLETRFHGYYHANYTPFFVSDPVDFATPAFQATPIGLGWWTVQRDDEVLRYFRPDVPQSTKLLCHVEIPSCIGQPEDFCNRGQCNNQTGLCECNEGIYFGSQCELLKACYEQESAQCGGNGICESSSGVCRCNLPYFGKLCEQTYKCYEKDGLCRNGGICNVVTGACECPEDPAIHGVACELRKDCSVFGCFNGGVCSWENGVCTCPPPFYGANCALLNTSMTEYLCSTDLDCFNGTCTVETGICACGDPASYGTLCEHQFNCTESTNDVPCLNDGYCNNSTGLCECGNYWDGYFGADCSKYEPCTKDTDCDQDNGSANCDVASGECVCALGIAQGPKCELSDLCFKDMNCNRNGYCDVSSYTCQCGIGYGGHLCRSFLVGVYESWRDEVQATFEQEVIDCNFEPDCYDY